MADTRPRVLVISEFTSEPDELRLSSLLQECAGGKYTWIFQTVMDLYMKGTPANLALAIFDVGLVTAMHREVLDRLLEAGRVPVLAHVTDDRLDTLRYLREHPGIQYLKKPASLHDILSLVETTVAGQKPPPP